MRQQIIKKTETKESADENRVQKTFRDLSWVIVLYEGQECLIYRFYFINRIRDVKRLSYMYEYLIYFLNEVK